MQALVVIFVHSHLGTRATLLDVRQQVAAAAYTTPKMLVRVHFVWIVEDKQHYITSSTVSS